MAKRTDGFDKTVWDTGVSPVACSKSETCSVCQRSTGSRYFWVEERVMCERCADKTIGIGGRKGASAAQAMLFGVVTMVVLAVAYVLMHLGRG